MRFRSKPAGVVVGAIGEGTLNLPEDCARAAAVAGGPFKFTLTSPYMLARTLLDSIPATCRALTLAIADALAAQAGDLVCDCVQVDEANIPGNPGDAPLAAEAINRVLDAVRGDQGRALLLRQLRRADDSGRHLAGARRLPERRCTPTTWSSSWRTGRRRISRRSRDLRADIGIGIGVVDIKVNHVETADEIAAAIERAERALGAGRVRYVHPDCGFWMLKRSVADRKIAALVKGRDLVPRSMTSREVHAGAVRPVRAADAHPFSLPLRHREHDGRAAGLRSRAQVAGRRTQPGRPGRRRASAEVVHQESGDDVRAGSAGDARR